MSGPDVSALAADLARAVELTMSSSVSQSDRLKAYNACESFKETSPLCAETGLFLAAGTQHSLISRHFGLQLMEHTVKYRWTTISQAEKIFIKENSMKLLSEGGIGDEPHLKDALSRVIVEMVKREWPQQWPGLLRELSDACNCGEAQTELVLMVFLRLVEDVALLQTLESNQRRKDIYYALTVNMVEIFDFFLRLIELHMGQFRSCTDEFQMNKANAHGRVVQVVLHTLAGFVEWVSMVHIMVQNGRLLHILCILLNDTVFRHAAAECLSQIVNRKGKAEERKPLLCLFVDEPIRCLLSAAKQPDSPTDEQSYLFKKKLVQVINGMVNQLCLLWGKEGVTRPNNFNAFLDAIIAFSSHDSLTLAHMANPMWSSMLKHEHIERDPVFLSYIPHWVQCTAPKIIKINFYGPTNTSKFARVDFDSEEEFTLCFYRFRCDILDSFRQATVVAPLITFNYVEQWLLRCIQEHNATSTSQISIPIDNRATEWEAVSSFLESILSKLLQAHERPSVTSGLHLLQMCLLCRPEDPLILSILLTCISALFVFLSMSTGQMAPQASSVAASGAALLPQVLDKIFSTFMLGPTKELRSRAVKNARRHAASLMVKISHKYPLLLLPLFDQIRATVDNLSNSSNSAALTTLERVTLYESLLLISNHFCDYERQSVFVRELLNDMMNNHWIRIQRAGATKNAATFIEFAGLHCAPIDESIAESEDVYCRNRTSLVYCSNLILGVIKRCAWPDDPERATRGGFVVSLTESGNPICRNPAAAHVIPLLPHLFSFIRIFNEMFTSEINSILNECYRGICLTMMENEKNNLLGQLGAQSGENIQPILLNGSPHAESNSNIVTIRSTFQIQRERMQRFLCCLHESCYHTIGTMGSSLGRDFYALQDLGLAITNSVLAHIEVVPDYRLRSIIRVFLKPFIHYCPVSLNETVLIPVIANLAPIMLNRLHIKWSQVNKIKERELQQDESTETQEVIDDILTRVITREYLDVLKVALVGGSLTPESNAETMETDDLTQNTVPALLQSAPTCGSQHAIRSSQLIITNEVISELGISLLRNEKTCHPIVLSILGSLAWIDSNASFKATLLIGPVVRQLVQDASLHGDMAAHIMASVLNALALHGQHESNQGSLLTLGAQMYEMLRPNFIQVYSVMQQIPGMNPLDIQKLDERIFQTNMAKPTTKGNKIEKVKKDLFKRITNNMVGRSVGELFKKEIKIQDLPQLLPRKNAEYNPSASVINLHSLFKE